MSRKSWIALYNFMTVMHGLLPILILFSFAATNFVHIKSSTDYNFFGFSMEGTH